MEPHVKIKIGEVHASAEPVIIETVLGSCVSVCLFDPRFRIGGMNHILLPGKANEGDFNLAARYGVNAMEILINSLMKLGVRRNSIIAKVFGGAKMFNHIEKDLAPGLRNVKFAMNFLEVEKIPVVSSDVGGEKARKILFASGTGEVLLKRLPVFTLCVLGEKERRFSETTNMEMKKKTKITIF